MSRSHGKNMKALLSCALAVFLVSAFNGTASAQYKPNIHVGALEIHPYACVEQTYDSNIYLEPRNRENADNITDIRVGTAVKLPIIPEREEDFLIEGSYHADIIEFWKYKHRDRVDHHARGLLDCTFANDFRLRIRERFEKTADPPDSERTTLDKRYRNVVNPTLSYTREKITLEGGYEMTRDAYDENRLNNLNRTDHVFTGTCFYQVLPKTSVLAEYNLGLIRYDNHRTNSDSVENQARIGVIGKLWPKLTGTLKLGYRYVSYNESDKTDYSNFTMFANLKYDMTERTIVNLFADRTSQESSYASNSYYEMNKVALNVDHLLAERLRLDGGGFIGYNRYPVTTIEGDDIGKRKDFLWGANAGLKYDIKEWLFVDVGYKFKQRTSRFSVYDYNDHKISAQLCAKF